MKSTLINTSNKDMITIIGYSDIDNNYFKVRSEVTGEIYTIHYRFVTSLN